MAATLAAFHLAAAVLLTTAQPGRTNDSTVMRRARGEAYAFMRAWRGEWKKGYREPGENIHRLAAGHCHLDARGYMASPNIIPTRTRKSQCPSWLTAPAPDAWDERLGIDGALREEGRLRVRARRAKLLAVLDTALAAVPGHASMHGQRVRFAVDQRDEAHAWRAVDDCRGGAGWCDLLGMYVAASFGDISRADSLLGRALQGMSLANRCAWSDIALLLTGSARTAWRERDCAQRMLLAPTFWWLADPFWSVPGNERRREHFVRMVTVSLRAELQTDERFDWRARVGGDGFTALVVRYGWPAFFGWLGTKEDLGHREWLGFHDNAVPTLSPEYIAPRVHVIPPWHAVLVPLSLQREDWRDMSARWEAREWDPDWWADEHMALPVSGIVGLTDQTAFFRRALGAMALVAAGMPASFAPDSVRPRYEAALVVSANPDSAAVARPQAVDAGRVAFTVETREPAIMSIELIPASGSRAPAGRSRYAVVPPSPLLELPAGEIALSDLALYRVGTEMPGSLDQLLPLMHSSLRLPRGDRIGLFWEVYGVNAGEPFDVEVRVESESQSLLRRLGAIAGIVDPPSAVAIRWREPGPARAGPPFLEGGVGVQPHSFVLDARSLPSGRYLLTVRVSRQGGRLATSVREFQVD